MGLPLFTGFSPKSLPVGCLLERKGVDIGLRAPVELGAGLGWAFAGGHLQWGWVAVLSFRAGLVHSDQVHHC